MDRCVAVGRAVVRLLQQPGATVPVRLDVVEPLGSEALLSARVGAKEIMARVRPRGLPAAGSEVGLRFRGERVHFFEEESGEAVGVVTKAP